MLDKSKYVSSIIYVYLFMFLVIVPVLNFNDGNGLLYSLRFFVKTLFFGVPVAILAFTLGFYIFRHSIEMIEINYFLRVMVSFLFSIVACSFVAAICLGIVFGFGFQNLDFSMVIIFIPIAIVGSISALLYWYRTK
ncbi:hypothetical protein CWC16_08850 [Pseudoalteromonas sp. S3776]|uniref:hypothetical protein n=1 Tax=unclassified Pseudoalteromonas TaxID=194690 RepID=UPI001108070C|nr:MULTISPECIES: hypothetical protein [unclassified Pseudoalteromonas]TMO74257.1 hypothetical protein CWC17_08665 [Pseudoalteromonas sp. S3785]TMO80273.1 hypothetical protein CWC16_08850 [Pseudoalteromonas sp. S3776]